MLPKQKFKKKKKKITHKNLQLGSLYYSWSIQTNIFKTTCYSLKRFLESPTTFEQKHPWSQEFTYAQCSFEAVGKWQMLFVCLKKHVDKWRVKVFCSPISLALLPGWNEVVYYKLQGYLSLPSMKSLLDKPGYTIISWMHHIYPYPSFKECYSCYMSIMSQLSWEAGGKTGIEEGMLFFTGWTSCVSIWGLELGSHLMIPGIQPEDQATCRSWRSRRTERI